jgi:structural maintenance of chromosome 2
LRKRVTIIPLNKISAFKASAEKIGAAKKLAPGKVDLALSLVGYNEEITKAMEYVFGSTFICDDAETAKLVTFNNAVRMRCVTVEGDVYDPSGTLSGGSSPSSSGILIQMQKLNEITRELEIAKNELRELVALMGSEGQKVAEARKLKQQLDLKEHETKLSEDQINSNSHSKVVFTRVLLIQIIMEVQGMKDTIIQLKETIKSATVRQDEAKQDVKRIEKDMNEFKNNKDSKLKQLQVHHTTTYANYRNKSMN